MLSEADILAQRAVVGCKGRQNIGESFSENVLGENVRVEMLRIIQLRTTIERPGAGQCSARITTKPSN